MRGANIAARTMQGLTRRELVACSVPLSVADSMAGARQRPSTQSVGSSDVPDPLNLVDPELRGFLRRLPTQCPVYFVATLQKLRSNTKYAAHTAQQSSLPGITARTVFEFARRSMDAGVPTQLYVAPGAYHGFLFLVLDAGVSRRFTGSFNSTLASAFSQSS